MKKIIDLKYIDTYTEFITDFIFLKNFEGDYLYSNKEYASFFNLIPKDIIGKNDYDLFPSEIAEKCFRDEQKTLENDFFIEFEDKIIYKNKINYFKTKKQKVYNTKDEPIGILSITKNITETKQYQLLYEDNNELLEYMNQESNTQQILNKIVTLSEKRNPNLKCSILLLDENKTYLYNGAAPSLPSFYTKAVHGLKIGKNVGSCGAAAYNKKRVIIENLNTHPNWSGFLAFTQKANLHSCWSEPIFSANNEILGTFAMYSNQPNKPSDFELKLIASYAHLAALTIEKENKKIKADIKKREELQDELDKKTTDLQLFKQVVDNISYGVTLTKADDTYELIYVNKAFETITGYKKEDVLGKNCRFLQNDDKEQESIKILKKALKDKKRVQVELRNYKKDGTLFYNLINVAPVHDLKKDITHFVGIQKNITQEKKQEALLTEQSKLASMGEMIANIAHQWRQPLSVISTAATGMQLQQEFNMLTDKQFKNASELINDNVQYLSQTIDDFKNFIQKDSIQTYFKLSKSIKKFLSLVSGTVKNNNIELVLELDDTIELNGFENELIQCYMNIFNNAKDVLQNSEEKLIVIKSFIKNNMIYISIKDNGGGITDDVISKIFEPYFTTKYKHQGTGLGLHMTYNLIVEGMKGSIKANNCHFLYKDKKFIGAEFIIILPIS